LTKLHFIFLKEIIMKKLTTTAIAILATTASAFAFAAGNGNGNSGNGVGNGGQQPSNGNGTPTLQATMLVNTALINSATGPTATAQQNLASNVGSFSSTATELQLVSAKDAFIANTSVFGGQASQNIASNASNSTSNGLHTSTYQVAFIKDSAVINRASFGGKAVQNLSSNSNCLTCAPQ
jgi:hypothetical protein